LQIDQYDANTIEMRTVEHDIVFHTVLFFAVH